jgi:hypothetical protein
MSFTYPMPDKSTGDLMDEAWYDTYVRDNADWLYLRAVDGLVKTNRIINGSFEVWENGTAAAPDNWAVTGASATVARDGSNVQIGNYSAAFTRSGVDCHLSQDAYTEAGGVYIQSRPFTFGVWVKATAASRARLRVYDGVAAPSYSDYHTGAATYEFLTVSITPDAAATQLECGLQIDNGDTTAYLDGATLVEGPICGTYAPHAHDFNGLPQRATMWHDEATVIAGGAIARVVNTVFPYNMIAVQTPDVLNDEFKHGFLIQAGNYTLYALGVTANNRGQVTWYIDDVVQGVAQDWYSAATTGNVEKTTSITVVGDGWHILKGKVLGKNASSSGYSIPLTKYWIK